MYYFNQEEKQNPEVLVEKFNSLNKQKLLQNNSFSTDNEENVISNNNSFHDTIKNMNIYSIIDADNDEIKNNKFAVLNKSINSRSDSKNISRNYSNNLNNNSFSNNSQNIYDDAIENIKDVNIIKNICVISNSSKNIEALKQCNIDDNAALNLQLEVEKEFDFSNKVNIDICNRSFAKNNDTKIEENIDNISIINEIKIDSNFLIVNNNSNLKNLIEENQEPKVVVNKNKNSVKSSNIPPSKNNCSSNIESPTPFPADVSNHKNSCNTTSHSKHKNSFHKDLIGSNNSNKDENSNFKLDSLE